MTAKHTFYKCLLIGSVLAVSTAQAQIVSNPFDPYDPFPQAIGQSAISINLHSIASGFTAPNLLTHASDGSDRLFVLDQKGSVQLIKNGVVQANPFLKMNAAFWGLHFIPITPMSARRDTARFIPTPVNQE